MKRAFVVLVVGLLGCGDKATSTPPSASAVKSAAPVASAPPALPAELPPITVDEQGVFWMGERANLKENDGLAKLKKAVGGKPLGDKEIKVIALKKASSTDVFALVRELAAAGVAKLEIKAEGRGDLPKEFVIVPAAKLTEKPAACSVVAMVSKNLATDVWSVKGGTGKRHVKGFAGPDLSNTGETLKKDLEKCDSSVAFFSVDDALEWELGHMIGGAILANDEGKKIKSLVLLDEVPVPGRPVKGFGE